MEKLRAWLGRQGFSLDSTPGATDQVELISRRVTLNASAAYQHRLSALMHECGHVRIFLARTRRPRTRISGATLREDLLKQGRCDLRARASRLSVLQEELEAWESGERLARNLGVRYARRRFEKLRARCLLTYVRHASERMRAAASPPVASLK